GFLFHRQHGFFLVPLVEELQAESDNLGIKLGVSAFILIFFGLEPAFEINQAALFQVFLADLSEPTPGLDVDPFGIFLQLAARLPALRNGQTEVSYFFSGGRILALGVLAQTSDQLNAI